MKTEHPDNPMGSDWERMADDRDYYIVGKGHSVGTCAYFRTTKGANGETRFHSRPGVPLGEGDVFPAKQLGPGAEVGRLAALGAIREAYPHEVDAFRRLHGNPPGTAQPMPNPDVRHATAPDPEVNDKEIEKEKRVAEEMRDQQPMDRPVEKTTVATGGSFNQPPKGNGK